MNTHNKKFIITLIALLLIVIGAIFFTQKQQVKQSEVDFGYALMSGAIQSNPDCLVSAWGQQRYDELSEDSSAITDQETEQLSACLSS